MLESVKILVYVLCIGAGGVCAYLLLRGYWRSGTRLLLWSGICFAFLSLNSLAVLLEIVIYPSTDLRGLRSLASLAAVATMVFGLVWETE